MLPGETILSGAEFENGVSEFMVLESNAGWYVGTLYYGEDGLTEPNTRETGYFPTEADAQDALDVFKKTGFLRGQRT